MKKVIVVDTNSMDIPFFSIIIPVYNVETYIQECLESVYSQDFNSYEVILVDDGSTDASGAICDRFKLENTNTTVIHQLNGGLSVARNSGLQYARGKYVLFIDSDDYIAENSLCSISQCIIENEFPDVIFLNSVKVFPNGYVEPMGEKLETSKINGKPKVDVLDFIATRPKFPGSACSKAVKCELIAEDLFFVPKLISEDIEWSCRLFRQASTFAYCNQDYYYYRQNRKESITASSGLRGIESLFHIIECVSKKKPKDKIDETMNSFMAYQYIVLLLQISHVDDCGAVYYDRLKALKWVLKYGKSNKSKFVNIVSSLFGIKKTGWLLKKYREIYQTKRNTDLLRRNAE